MLAFLSGTAIGFSIGILVGAVLARGKASDLDLEAYPGLENFIRRRIDEAVEADRKRPRDER